jgi:hypothetical protein
MLHYLTDPGASAASAVALQKGVRNVGMSARICNRKRDTLALHGTWTLSMPRDDETMMRSKMHQPSA